MTIVTLILESCSDGGSKRNSRPPTNDVKYKDVRLQVPCFVFQGNTVPGYAALTADHKSR